MRQTVGMKKEKEFARILINEINDSIDEMYKEIAEIKGDKQMKKIKILDYKGEPVTIKGIATDILLAAIFPVALFLLAFV